MKNLLMKVVVVVLVLASVVLAMPMNVLAAERTVSDKKFEETLLNSINAEREKAGLSALKYDSKMQDGADIRAAEASKLWSHVRPDGSDYYTADAKRIYGENLGKDFSSVEDLVSGWMASPTHKENILFGDFKTCAIGYLKNGNGQYLVALEFGY